jgi:hypothetical protein
MNRDHRSARRFAGSALTATVVLAFFILSASASAATSTSKSSATVFSAAHSQYGNAHVLKPTAQGVAAIKHSTVKHSTVHAAPARPVSVTRSAGTLPFTGVSLLKLLLVALGMMVLGVILRGSKRRHES